MGNYTYAHALAKRVMGRSCRRCFRVIELDMAVNKIANGLYAPHPNGTAPNKSHAA